MLRPIAFAAALLVALPHAARAQWSDDDQPRAAQDNPRVADDDGQWDDGQWSGDDELSDMNGPPSPGDPADGYAPPNGPGSYAAQQPPSDYAAPPPPDSAAPPADYASAPQAGPSMDDFRSGLSDYGRWVDTPQYGLVWQPVGVNYGWRPYWDGHWVYTSAGWTWVTNEPWGWATYHYGRWAYVDGPGWIWLPGRVWAPAWVAWRWGEGVAGWCPLGPRGVVYEQPRYWVFVQSRRFLEPVRRYALPYSRVRYYYARARPLPIYRPGPRWGPPTRIVEVETHRPIRVVPIIETHKPGVRAVAGGIQVFRPRTQPIFYRHDGAQPQRPGVGPVVQPVIRPATPPREFGDRRPQPQPVPHELGDRRPQPIVVPREGDRRPDPQPAPHEFGDRRPHPAAPRPVGDQRPQPSPHAFGDQRPQAPAPRPAEMPSNRDASPVRNPPAEWGVPMRQGPAQRAEPARPATPARPAEKEPARPATPAEPHGQRPAERPQPALAAHAEAARPAPARFESRGGAAPRPAAAPHAAPAARPVEKKKQ